MKNQQLAVTTADTILTVFRGEASPSQSTIPEVLYQTNSAISALRVVRLVNSRLTLCDASTVINACSAIGITTSAVVASGVTSPKHFGLLIDSSWSWDTSRPIYCGTNGILTQDISGLAFALVVATVVSPDTIFINLQLEIRL